MTTLYVTLGVIAVVGILVWLLSRSAKSQGAAEQKADDATARVRQQQTVEQLVREAAETPPDREANVKRLRDGKI